MLDTLRVLTLSAFQLSAAIKAKTRVQRPPAPAKPITCVKKTENMDKPNNIRVLLTTRSSCGTQNCSNLHSIFLNCKPTSQNPHLVFAGEPAKEQTQDQPSHNATYHLQQTLQYVHPRRTCRTNSSEAGTTENQLGRVPRSSPVEKAIPRHVEKPVMARMSSKLPAAISSVGIPCSQKKYVKKKFLKINYLEMFSKICKKKKKKNKRCN